MKLNGNYRNADALKSKRWTKLLKSVFGDVNTNTVTMYKHSTKKKKKLKRSLSWNFNSWTPNTNLIDIWFWMRNGFTFKFGSEGLMMHFILLLIWFDWIAICKILKKKKNEKQCGYRIEKIILYLETYEHNMSHIHIVLIVFYASITVFNCKFTVFGTDKFLIFIWKKKTNFFFKKQHTRKK